MNYIPYILVMAIVTYLIRMIPITFFRKEITNRFVKSFLTYIPYAVLASMTFPAILNSSQNILASIIGCVVALVFAYLQKDLLIVAILSCFAVWVVNIIM